MEGEELVKRGIEMTALGIEVLAVAIIVIAIVHGTGHYLIRIQRQAEGAYEKYKVQLGRALLLGLEFLVAADIIRTVALEPSLRHVLILALLVIVRTFLSWSVVVEIEGRWPWAAEPRASEERR
jgi:uncharacterized membrane protein